jgi:hypothetical protein
MSKMFTVLELDFIEALQEISEAKGPYKSDPFDHCRACVTDMQRTAFEVLRKHGIAPRGRPVE